MVNKVLLLTCIMLIFIQWTNAANPEGNLSSEELRNFFLTLYRTLIKNKESTNIRCDSPPMFTKQELLSTVKEATDFGLEILMKEINKTYPANYIMSPYSINIMLAMLYIGAEGETREEMTHIIKFPDGYQAAYNGLIRSMHRRDEIILNTANAFFIEKNFKVLKQFMETLTCTLEGTWFDADFQNNPKRVSKNINRWVENATNGNIQEMVSPGDINDLTRMVLVNAIYFKGTWPEPFNEADPDWFYLRHDQRNNENRIKVSYMTKVEELKTTTGLEYTSVRIPYKGDEIAAYIVIPLEMSLKKMVETFLEDKSLFHDLVDSSKMEMTTVKLKIPKFKVEQTLDLKKDLEKLGLERMFVADKAEFGAIADGIFVSNVFHKAEIEVNIYGTEASAASAASVSDFRRESNPKIIRVDTPFMFVVKDEKSNSILFQGALMEPEPVEDELNYD